MTETHRNEPEIEGEKVRDQNINQIGKKWSQSPSSKCLSIQILFSFCQHFLPSFSTFSHHFRLKEGFQQPFDSQSSNQSSTHQSVSIFSRSFILLNLQSFCLPTKGTFHNVEESKSWNSGEDERIERERES